MNGANKNIKQAEIIIAAGSMELFLLYYNPLTFRYRSRSVPLDKGDKFA